MSKRLNTWLVIFGSVVLLGSCNYAQIKESGTFAEPALEEEPPEIPNQELTSELLYNFLVAEIAQQRNEALTAAESMLAAARESQDYRLAVLASQKAVLAKDYDRALAAARLWLGFQPESTHAKENLALIHVLRQENARAEEVFLSILQGAPENRRVIYRRIAEILSRQKSQDDMLALMDKLIAPYADLPEAYFAKAYLADQFKKMEIVNTALDKALELDPSWIDAATAKFSYLVADGKQQEATKFALDFVRRNPEKHQFRLRYARYLSEIGEREESLKQFKAIVRADETNTDALFAAGLVSVQLDKLNQGARYLRRLVKLQPRNDQARLYLGQVLMETKQYSEAEAVLAEIDSPSQYFDAQILLVRSLAETTGVESALEHAKRIQARGEEQRVRVILAQEQVLREGKLLLKAKEVLDEALLELPENTELLYARGLIAANLKLLELHERDLRKLLAKEPDNAHALNALGYTLADQTDRHDEAFELLKKAIALKPDDPFVMDSMGWVHFRLGNHEEAVDYLERALEARPDAEIAAHLGEVLWVTGEVDRAKSIWRDALKNAPENEVLLDTIGRFQGKK